MKAEECPKHLPLTSLACVSLWKLPHGGMAGLWDVLHSLLGVSSCRTGEAAGHKGELTGLTHPRVVLYLLEQQLGCVRS